MPWVGMMFVQYGCSRSVATALFQGVLVLFVTFLNADKFAKHADFFVQWQPTSDILTGYSSPRPMA
jgi:hypothetical protein